jgi:hypothetical protein
MANCLDDKLERHPRYMAFAQQTQKNINKITCDSVRFCLADPEPMVRKIQDELETMLRVFKHFHGDEIKPRKAGVVRHLIISAPG